MEADAVIAGFLAVGDGLEGNVEAIEGRDKGAEEPFATVAKGRPVVFLEGFPEVLGVGQGSVIEVLPLGGLFLGRLQSFLEALPLPFGASAFLFPEEFVFLVEGLSFAGVGCFFLLCFVHASLSPF